MDALLIGPAVALSFFGTLYVGKLLLSALVKGLENRAGKRPA
jgi:hypothetical protein